MKHILLVFLLFLGLIACKNDEKTIYCEEASVCDLQVYPIPADSLVNIAFRSNYPMNGVVQLFNLNGQKIDSLQLIIWRGENVSKLDLSGFAKGMYLLRLKTKDTSAVQRIVKQ